MMPALAEQADALRHLIKSDLRVGVRHPVQLVVLAAEGEPVVRVARLFRTAPHGPAQDPRVAQAHRC
jgi:hypothetical protein